MAGKKKAVSEPVDGLDADDEDLDRAIDGLRGVLRKDADGRDGVAHIEAGEDDMSSGKQAAVSLDDDFGADFTSDFAPDQENDDPLGAMFAESDPVATEPAEPAPARRSADASDHIPESVSRSRAVGLPRDETPPNLDLVMDIPIEMQIVLGTSRMPVSGLMNLAEGSLIGLDRRIGEPVEIMVNGRLFGRGEITVLEGDETHFGIRLIEVMDALKK